MLDEETDVHYLCVQMAICSLHTLVLKHRDSLHMTAHPDLADRFARALTFAATAYLCVRIGMGLLPA